MVEIQVVHGSYLLYLELPGSIRLRTVAPSGLGGEKQGTSRPRGVELIRASISASLREHEKRIAGAGKILLLVDDNTRVTPVQLLVEPVVKVARVAGASIEMIVAGGSHRPMTRQEKVAKFGEQVVETIPIHDHAWDDPATFVHLGTTPSGRKILVNKRLADFEAFVVALGNIVPHRVCGFSGGYKIILPGLTCTETMNDIHYMSAMVPSEQLLGIARNPVRDAINEIHRYRPVDFLINTVLDARSNIVSLCLGDPINSQFEGAAAAKQVYGAHASPLADVVIADAVPESLDFWVCAKALTNCKSFVKPGGHLVVFMPCTEGFSAAHGAVLLKYGYHAPAKIDEMVADGTIDRNHLLEASHLAHVGEVLSHCHVHLVSDGLDPVVMGKQGFDVVRAGDVDHLLTSICKDKDVTVVRRGSEICPIMQADVHA